MSDLIGEDPFRGLGSRVSRSAYDLMDKLAGLSTIEALSLARATGSDWPETLAEIARGGPRSLRSIAEDALRLGRAEVQLAKETAAQSTGRSI